LVIEFKNETETRCKVKYCYNRALKDGLCHGHYRAIYGVMSACSAQYCFNKPVYATVENNMPYGIELPARVHFRCEKHKRFFSLKRDLTKEIIPLDVWNSYVTCDMCGASNFGGWKLRYDNKTICKDCAIKIQIDINKKKYN
jgi:hypothetical protein